MSLFDAQEEVDKKCNRLIGAAKRNHTFSYEAGDIFMVSWASV